MTEEQTTQHNQFKAAKQIALSIEAGYSRRAKYDNAATCYTGYKSADGRMFVIGDCHADILNPDAIIDGRPAREVFGDFSIMSR